MQKCWLTKSKLQYNQCQPLSFMNPILSCWVRHVLMLVYFYYSDKNPGWVQMAVNMRITMRRARSEVHQSTRSCGFGDAMEFTLDLSFPCLDFEYVYLCNELKIVIVIRHWDILSLQFVLYVLHIWFTSNFAIQNLGVTL
jgi:hypothetical protein